MCNRQNQCLDCCCFRPQDIVWGERDMIHEEKKRPNKTWWFWNVIKLKASYHQMGPIKSGLWLGLFIYSSVCALFLVHYQRAPDNHSQKPYQTNPVPREFTARRGKRCPSWVLEWRQGRRMTDRGREGWGTDSSSISMTILEVGDHIRRQDARNRVVLTCIPWKRRRNKCCHDNGSQMGLIKCFISP